MVKLPKTERYIFDYILAVLFSYTVLPAVFHEIPKDILVSLVIGLLLTYPFELLFDLVSKLLKQLFS